MTISNKSDFIDFPPSFFNNTQIEEVCEHRHLGVIISKTLSWTSHINNLYAKANKRLGVLKSVQFKIDRKSLEQLYMSCILPVLEYGDIVWDGAFDRDLAKLEQLHQQAARIVTGGTQRCNINSLMEEICWKTLFNRRKFHRLTLFYKIINGKSPPYLEALLPQHRGEGSGYRLRSSENFTVILTRLSL